jgi:hypothetical protein
MDILILLATHICHTFIISSLMSLHQRQTLKTVCSSTFANKCILNLREYGMEDLF